MSDVNQRIAALRQWLKTGDPQIAPDWSDWDLHTMRDMDVSPTEHARRLIENHDWIMTGD